MEQSFRTAMLGFQKEDVARFIYQQNKNFEKKLAEKDAELKAVSAKHQEETELLRLALFQAQEKNGNWQENEDLTRQILSLTVDFQQQIQDFLAAMDQEKDCLEAVESDYSALRERCCESEAFREKAEKFDSLASVLSSMMGGVSEQKESPCTVSEAMPETDSIHRAKLQWEEKQAIVNALSDSCRNIAEALQKFKF